MDTNNDIRNLAANVARTFLSTTQSLQ